MHCPGVDKKEWKQETLVWVDRLVASTVQSLLRSSASIHYSGGRGREASLWVWYQSGLWIEFRLCQNYLRETLSQNREERLEKWLLFQGTQVDVPASTWQLAHNCL